VASKRERIRGDLGRWQVNDQEEKFPYLKKSIMETKSREISSSMKEGNFHQTQGDAQL